MKKILFISILTMSLSLTGCWSSFELNKLAIASAIGIDKINDEYVLTLQIIDADAIASEKQVVKSPIVVFTEKGKDVFELIRRMTTQTSRKIYLSHLRIVVFGQDYAEEGIIDILDFLSRYHEFRTDFYFTVAKGETANSILKHITTLEINPSIKIFSSLEASENLWAATKTTRIIELVNNIVSDGVNPVLTGISFSDSDNSFTSVEDLKNTEIKQLKLEDLGVFRNEKLVGWLNVDESKGYNFITGNVKNSVGFVELEPGKKITIQLSEKKAKQMVYVEDNKMGINVEIDINASIEGVIGDVDISKNENIEKIEQLAAKKVTIMCNQVVEKAKKELKSDIFGFGETVHRTYPKIWKGIKMDWNNEFESLPVNILVRYKIERTGATSKPFFVKEKE